MIICIIQNALQTPTPNTGFTQRLYSVHAARTQRAHGALEDPTACLKQTPPRGVLCDCTARTQR